MTSHISRPASVLAFITVFVALCLMALPMGDGVLAQENPHELKAQKQVQAPVPILAYHRFDSTTPGPTTVTTRVFEQQLQWLAAHHYKIVPLRTVVDSLRGMAPPVASPAVVITIDDGHRSVYTQLFPIIRRERIPVTLFIYPSAISHASYALTWDQLKEMVKTGLVEVQSHTFWHPDFRKERLRRTPKDYRAFVDLQLTRSKAILESRLGIKVNMLAWPFGIVDKELETAAARAGYVAAFAYEGGLATADSDLFALPRLPVSNAARGASFSALLSQVSLRKPNP
jgi:peptidoglycan/xylan/chitin deacetylase (PgdA/CDA1 family)